MDENNLILQKSYEHTMELHKFFVSFRFKVVAYLATVNAVLFYFIFHDQPKLGIAILVSIIGVLSVLALYLLDRRTRELFQICIDSGSEIENYANIPSNIGIYQKLKLRPLGRWSHGLVIRDSAILLVLAWIAIIILLLCNPSLLNIK
jgi:hypothetical protein